MSKKYLFKIKCEKCGNNYLSVGFIDELSAGVERTICPDCKYDRYFTSEDKPIAILTEIRKGE